MKNNDTLKKPSRFQFKKLLKVANEAKTKECGFFLGLVFDIIVCSFKYDMSYKEYGIYDFHKLKAEDRKKFLMISHLNRINERYNHSIDREIFENKLLFANAFRDYIGREILDLRTAGQNRFNAFLDIYPQFVAKTLENDEKAKVSKHQRVETTDLIAARRQLLNSKKFLIESFIKQNDKLQELYPESVNTLRVSTFIDEEGNVQVLNTALKLGIESHRDNFSRGGLFSVPNDKGVIIRPFINKKGSLYETHPTSLVDLMGFEIPFYQEAINLAKECALKYPEVRYVGWDVAILNDRVIILDGTVFPKFFQMPPSMTFFMGEAIHNLRETYDQYMDLSR